MSRIFSLLAILSFSLFVCGQSSEKADELLRRGLRSHNSGNYAAAIDDFSRVIELTSTLTSTNNSKHQGFAETAENASERDNVRVVDRRTAAAYVNRGNTYFFMGSIDEALQDYERALRLSPGLAEGYMCRGGVWLLRKDYE